MDEMKIGGKEYKIENPITVLKTFYLLFGSISIIYDGIKIPNDNDMESALPVCIDLIYRFRGRTKIKRKDLEEEIKSKLNILSKIRNMKLLTAEGEINQGELGKLETTITSLTEINGLGLSTATKLLHPINRDIPILDSLVQKVYMEKGKPAICEILNKYFDDYQNNSEFFDKVRSENFTVSGEINKESKNLIKINKNKNEVTLIIPKDITDVRIFDIFLWLFGKEGENHNIIYKKLNR